MDIQGKFILVTGGGLRIGRALCEAFAEAGANLVIHCNRSREAAEELKSSLPRPEAHKIIAADFSQPQQVERLLEQAGHVDILINCASVFMPHPLDAESSDLFETQMRVNFVTPLELMKQFAAQKELEQGCIINFLDQQIGKIPLNGGSYQLSKQSLASTTLLAARQWAPRIRVNAIAPGPVLPPVGLKGKGMQKVIKEVPMGKQVALRDVTDSCLFLVRNESVTGQVLFVDGGQHLT